MANLNLESRVLRGLNVVRDVVTVLKRNGSNQAIAGFPAVLSSQRHLTSWLPADTDFGWRYERPAYAGVVCSAPRAGRLGSLAGVRAKRWQAIVAPRSVLIRKPRSHQPRVAGSMRDTFAGAMRRT
jgi:hypothetical protein